MENDKPQTPIALVAALSLGHKEPTPEGLYAAPMPETVAGWIAQGFTFRQPAKKEK